MRRDVTRPAPRLHVGQAVRIAACLQLDKVVRFESSCSIADNTPVVVALEHGPTGLLPPWAGQLTMVAAHPASADRRGLRTGLAIARTIAPAANTPATATSSRLRPWRFFVNRTEP